MKKVRKLILALLCIGAGHQVDAQMTGSNGLFDEKRQSSTLSERWELEKSTRKGTFLITPYKPIYIAPARFSNRPNGLPATLNPDNASTVPQDFDNFEAKFQLSFKTKVAQGLFWGAGDIWLAFTQTANWQVFNAKLSRPFRELNYEPEVMLNFPTNVSFLGLTNRMLGISLNHQSNGRSLPTSRSWNRVIFVTAFDYENISVIIRPWIRLSEDSKEDDNPRIEDYMGHGDAAIIYQREGQTFSLLARNNLKFNKSNKGYLEFNWSYPLSGNLKAHMQVANGYGETMIDFNHSQTTIGLGISLIDWL